MKAAIYTLGCKVNQNEGAALAELFRREGYTIAGPDETADVYIVNSCTVTAGGDAKSRRWLRRAKKQNPGAVTVLCGCMPQASPGDAFGYEADVVTGTAARARLPLLVAQYLQSGRRVVDISPTGKAFEELPAVKQAGRTRAFVKIEDGCNRRCAYCIIPTARGQVRSRAEADILAEVATHAAGGTREVVLTGINLPSYGRDTGTGLADIVERISAIDGIARIRLSSLDPDLLSGEDIARFAQVEKLCPQFHLSLQSGCGATLRRMRRPYTPDAYRQAAEALRQAMPDATLTTDVIVGFPGEDEAEFAESLAFVQETGFLKVHVFPYSRRPGTPAADFDHQVPRKEKEARAAAMQQAADAVRERLIAAREGEVAEVLLETPLDSGVFTGYTRHYIPVHIAAPGAAPGQLVAARLGRFSGEAAEGFVLDTGACDRLE